MSICPVCKKTVFFAEKITTLGSDWHKPCFRCSNESCKKLLVLGKQSDRQGKPYCARCHSILFGQHSNGPSESEIHQFHESEMVVYRM
ncbi:hypothetical protein CRE_16632 [Caenorhabditis remanei]|uniref:Cysteine-rich protein 1 n=1 Tax=Caenorhabditis remanei TaxID=31234 RepID=E3MAU4_CAERE|nr:hypothetical protein CRE_16632 [Caenorhabditis remanei]